MGMGRKLVALGVLAGAGLAAREAALGWQRTWGVRPEDVDRVLPGDDLVEDAAAEDTRSLVIGAPPEDVWPWLVQMGYGKAGWYSYDAVDMKGSSAWRIVPEWQDLDVGAIMPTHPGGGFVVKEMDPGHALVLYWDSALSAEQEAAAAAAAAAGRGEAMPPNLRAAGEFMTAAGRDFAASWAFVLEPAPGGTRLIERVRARMEEGGPFASVAASALGFGVFVMMRKQMLGIRDRAERTRREETIPVPLAAPIGV